MPHQCQRRTSGASVGVWNRRSGVLLGEGCMSTRRRPRARIARAIRLMSVPIILGWLLVTAATNIVVPQLEMVGKEHSVSLSPQDAPALIAMKRLGSRFEQFDSDSMAMIVLEGEQPLADDAHRYYDELVRRLEQDTKH